MENKPKRYKCGLIMPIALIDNCSPQHWEAIRMIIKEALEDTDYEVNLVSDSNEIGIIQKRIIQNTYSNDIIICDVSAKNPNVMFELGMRLAFDKPVIIIKDDFTSYSFDTGMIEHLNYPRDLNYHAIQAFKVILKAKLVATHEASVGNEYVSFLSHFPTVTASKVPEKEVTSTDFILESISEMRDEIRILSKSNVYNELGQGSVGPVHIQLAKILFENPNISLSTFSDHNDPNFVTLCDNFLRENRPSRRFSESGKINFRGIVLAELYRLLVGKNNNVFAA